MAGPAGARGALDVGYAVEVDTTSPTEGLCPRAVVTTLHLNGPGGTA